jgi:hypothetical protein
MLAIAALTRSTMHQSSLGSFLLMPDKLAEQGGGHDQAKAKLYRRCTASF